MPALSPALRTIEFVGNAAGAPVVASTAPRPYAAVPARVVNRPPT
jgi:hypothetical protein